MFRLFGKKSGDLLTLEDKLEILGRCGLSLAPPFSVPDLLESWSRDDFEKPGFTLTLVGLGMTEERPPWRNHCVNAWHFDSECIEDGGDYVRIAKRLSEMTQGSLAITNVRDEVDVEAAIASLDFDHSGKAVHLDFQVNDDWVDPSVFTKFVRLLELSDPSKIFLHHDTGGQDCVIACVRQDQVASLKEAGVEFTILH